MSLSHVFRDRHYEPGYVYIAGSLSERVIKIGVTKNIWSEQNYLRNKKYGDIRDWVLLYHVWLDEYGGKIEHDARRRLRRYRTLRMYEKDGSRQEARELVQCAFSTALEALSDCIGDKERSSAWQSKRCCDFEFGRDDLIEPSDLTDEMQSQPLEKGPFNLFKKVDELDFSVRTANCLKNANIVYVGELVQKTGVEMLRIPYFGRKSLNEIKEVLVQMGLHFGMEVPGWPPKNIEQVSTHLVKKVGVLQLSIRANSCLTNANIAYLGELVQKTDAEVLRMPNLGRRSLNEIKQALALMGLHLGMEVPSWPLGNIE